jgi:hypothetical protein
MGWACWLYGREERFMQDFDVETGGKESAYKILAWVVE